MTWSDSQPPAVPPAVKYYNERPPNSARAEGGLRTRGQFYKKSENERPLVSVITVVRNGEKYLEQTILSVINQTYDNIEYIVIDGGSTDGTLDIIRRYDNQIAYWMSEPDSGIYYAMNKALDLIKGMGHIFFNAGDYFVSDVFSKTPKIPSFIPVYYKDISGKLRKVRIRDYRQAIPNCHQGIIFETKAVRFNTNYKIASDYLYYLDHGYKNDIEFNNC